jgi:uncharacterized protein DUF4153
VSSARTPNASSPLAPSSLDRIAVSPERATLARRAVGGALALGVLADMLLRDGPIGIGIALWMLVFAGTATVLIWRRGELSREQGMLLAAAVLFASSIAWRDADDLQFFDFAATLAILLVLGGALRMPNAVHVFGSRVRDLAWASLKGVGDAVIGILPLVFRDAAFNQAFPAARRTNTARLVRAAVVTIPLLLIFGSLFRAADPVFDKLVRLPSFDVENLLSHIFLTGFFTWIVAGWFRGAIVSDDARPGAPDGFPIALSSLELTVVLGALNVLFASFVAVQIGWLFGGEALVRSTTGLSLAEYARRGFFELVWVSVLLLPVMLGANAALPKGDTAAAARFRQLSLPLLGLLGAVMVSALGRMSLYIQNYGLSTDRIDATAFMVWLAIVFVLFAFTVLRGRPTRFAGGMFVSGLGVLFALNVASPDAIVARVNVKRVLSGKSDQALDYRYLTSLSGDAIPSVVQAVLASPPSKPGTAAYINETKQRCYEAWRLRTFWGAPSDTAKRSWTTWNYGASMGHKSVRVNDAELAKIACAPADSSRAAKSTAVLTEPR